MDQGIAFLLSKMIMSIILKVKCHCLEKLTGQGPRFFFWDLARLLRSRLQTSILSLHLQMKLSFVVWSCSACMFSPVSENTFALYPFLLLGVSCMPLLTYLLCGGTVSMLARGILEQKSESTDFLFFLLLTSERQRHCDYFVVYPCARCLSSFLSFPTPGIYMIEKALLINLLPRTWQHIAQLAVQQGHHVIV